MPSSSWFETWNTHELYQDKAELATSCSDTSPIKEQGIVCGPIIRLRYVDYKDYLYHGSILVVTRGPAGEKAPKIEYVTGPSYPAANKEVRLNRGEFEPILFHTETFEESKVYMFRYTIMLPLVEHEQTVKYYLNGETTMHYRFFIPSRITNFNVISYSCNGFSLSTDTTTFKGSMWFDIMNKHAKVHYNVMLGGGDQIYSDGIEIFSDKVRGWMKTKDPIKKRRMVADEEFKRDINHFYLKEYLEWYGYGYWKGSTDKSKTTQSCFPIALASIPSINIWDDHDTIDGWGSYSNSLMKSSVFSSIGKSSFKYYLLFQHHVSMEEKDAYLEDKMWVLGKKPGPYLGKLSHSVFTRLGPNMAMLGLDCRTERSLKTIVLRSTYDEVFERLTDEVKNQKFDHLLLMLGVPIAYPRMVLLEWLFTSRILSPLKYLSRKGIIAPGFVNEFNGDVELLDDLNDHWCSRHHKSERNWLVARLQDFGAKYGVRITILSGDVHLAAIGRFRSKMHRHHLVASTEVKEANKIVDVEPETDPRLMINLISSAVTNAPPPSAVASVLQKKVSIHHFDHETDEDAVPIFKVELNGEADRHVTCFLPHRNWSDVIPIYNILNNEYMQNFYNLNLGERLFPGMVTDEHGLEVADKVIPDSSSNHPNPPYPVTERGIMTTLRIETEPSDIKSKTTAYSMPIPELRVTEDKLSHFGLKHLGKKVAAAK